MSFASRTRTVKFDSDDDNEIEDIDVLFDCSYPDQIEKHKLNTSNTTMLPLITAKSSCATTTAEATKTNINSQCKTNNNENINTLIANASDKNSKNMYKGHNKRDKSK